MQQIILDAEAGQIWPNWRGGASRPMRGFTWWWICR